MVKPEEASFELLIPDEQLAKAIEPTMRDLHNPSPGAFRRMTPFLFGFLFAPFDVRNVAMLLNDAKCWRAGIACVSAQMLVAPHRRFEALDDDAVQNGLQLTDIMSISAGHDDR